MFIIKPLQINLAQHLYGILIGFHRFLPASLLDKSSGKLCCSFITEHLCRPHIIDDPIMLTAVMQKLQDFRLKLIGKSCERHHGLKMRKHPKILPGRLQHNAACPANRIISLMHSPAHNDTALSLRFGLPRMMLITLQLCTYSTFIDAKYLCNPRDIRIELHGVLYTGQHRQHSCKRIDLALKVTIVRMVQNILHAVFHKRQGLLHQSAELISPVLADELIRVLAIRNHDDPHHSPCLTYNRQCADCRILPCIIAVIAKINLRRIAQKQFALFGRKRRTKRGHYIMHACAIHRNRIHIAFNHDGIAFLLDGTMRAVQTKKQSAFIEQQCLRRVQILRLTVIQNTSAKASYMSTFIRNRNNHTIAEPVIDSLSITAFCRKSALQKKFPLHPSLQKCRGKLIPGIRRITELKLLNCFHRNPPTSKISFCRRPVARPGQTIMEKIPGHLMDLAQISNFLLTRKLRR